MKPINKKISVVVGVGGTVGSAVSEKLKKEGFYVIGIDHEAKGLIKPRHLDLYHQCNLTNRSVLQLFIDEIMPKVGQIDYTFIALESLLNSTFESTPIESWNASLEVTLKGSANTCACIAPYMVERKSGHITLFSTDYSKFQGECILNATACGTLHGFAKSFGVEMAPHAVLVNVLSANIPYDLQAICEMAFFLSTGGEYISAQVLSVNGEERS